jgi:hypothetical protein
MIIHSQDLFRVQSVHSFLDNAPGKIHIEKTADPKFIANSPFFIFNGVSAFRLSDRPASITHWVGSNPEHFRGQTQRRTSTPIETRHSGGRLAKQRLRWQM